MSKKCPIAFRRRSKYLEINTFAFRFKALKMLFYFKIFTAIIVVAVLKYALHQTILNLEYQL
jgi:hypothetical protein